MSAEVDVTVGRPYAFQCGCGWTHAKSPDTQAAVEAIRAHLAEHSTDREVEA